MILEFANKSLTAMHQVDICSLQIRRSVTQTMTRMAGTWRQIRRQVARELIWWMAVQPSRGSWIVPRVVTMMMKIPPVVGNYQKLRPSPANLCPQRRSQRNPSLAKFTASELARPPIVDFVLSYWSNFRWSFCAHVKLLMAPCPPIESIMRLMTVWMITGKIIRTAVSLTYAQL